MLNKTAALVAALGIAQCLALGGDGPATRARRRRARGPRSSCAPRPRFAFSPAEIMFTAELKGGDDVEELYCPEIEWEWGDGARASRKPTATHGRRTTKLERRFTAHHIFQFAGAYLVRVTLRKAGQGNHDPDHADDHPRRPRRPEPGPGRIGAGSDLDSAGHVEIGPERRRPSRSSALRFLSSGRFRAGRVPVRVRARGDGAWRGVLVRSQQRPVCGCGLRS